ncbi:hypothetical protein AN217_06025 [Streptomyces qinglanensis]|uniref:Protein-glutamine gamma-glutamyltransferase-like C-terminal domain-containing protein n=1 Tax=Streptomyces qinglanensis TaxID=943816 RepID=A0A1E7K0M7_9ACTN|nr:DUF4129 domain-containing protein [Streptomyces qinglanensis]OEU97497.1 hypothetical protein AN217_06025 [Streptomyces qinglanensis]OEV24907.1 hypothetical protein AN220_16625 [Streptomyces nanshensis]
MPGGHTDALSRCCAAALHQTAHAAEGGGPVTTPRLPAREDAERELSRSEYHQHDPSLLQRALDWLWDRLGDLLRIAAEGAPGGSVGLTVLALVLVLLLLALRLRLGSLRAKRTTGSAALFPDRLRSAADHRTAAASHARADRWTPAVQERMRALVRSLEERALLDPRPGRTADEATGEAAVDLPQLADRLRAAARTFDEVSYAGRPADPADYALLRDLDDALLRTTPAPPASRTSAAPASQGWAV